jgi:hypothetical protein
MARDDVHFVKAQRFNVGLSTVFGITVTPGLNCVLVDQLSGGSFEIGGASLLWGQGYQYRGSAIFFNCAGTFYAAATSSTITIQCLFGYNQGV